MDYLNVAWTVLSMLLLFYAWQWYWQRQDYHDDCEPPAQIPYLDPFGFGAFIETAILMKNNQLFESVHSRFKEYGRTHMSKSLGRSVIHTMELENMQTYLSKNFTHWGVEPLRAPVRNMIGRGVISMDGHEWDTSRSLLKPTFLRSNIENFITLDTYLDQLFDKIPGDGSTIDMQTYILQMHLDVSSMFLFGEELGALSGNASVDAQGLRAAWDEGMIGTGLTMALGPLQFLYPKKKWLHACDELKMFAERYVNKTLAVRSRLIDQDTKKKSRTLLETIAAEDCSRTQLRDYILQGMLAAQEPPAILFSNCIYVLARRPDIWLELKDEACGVDLQKASFESLRTLNKISNFINETLRLYSIFPRSGRIALQDTMLPTGGGRDGKSKIFVRRGTVIQGAMTAIHRDPEIWGHDALEFKPERFDSFKPTQWQFMPFLCGPRACLGKQKALMDTFYSLVKLLQTYDSVENRDDRPWLAQMRVTTRCANGCLVALRRSTPER